MAIKNELWESFRLGRREAFSTLFHNYFPVVFQYGLKLHKDEEFLRDVIQDFFIYLYENRSGLSQNVLNPKSYIITSFRRFYLKTLKKRRDFDHKHDNFELYNSLFVIGIEDKIIKKEKKDYSKKIVGRLLTELSPLQREIVYLKYSLNMSLPEISETLEISYQVAANHLSRALKKLRGSEEIKKINKGDI